MSSPKHRSEGSAPIWGICPVCHKRVSNEATIHYDCWIASFGKDSPAPAPEAQAICPNCGFNQDGEWPTHCLSCGWPLPRKPAQAAGKDAASAHTPGPWKAERVSHRYGCYGHEIQPPYRGAMTMRNAPIAFINSDDEQDRANARLIAAAPETATERDTLQRQVDGLLAALKEIVSDYSKRGSYESMFASLQAAIANVEGK